MAGADVLLGFDVVIDNFKKEPALLGNCLDNVFEGFLVESCCKVSHIRDFAPLDVARQSLIDLSSLEKDSQPS